MRLGPAGEPDDVIGLIRVEGQCEIGIEAMVIIAQGCPVEC